jgi:S1-C subfamily serine protease
MQPVRLPDKLVSKLNLTNGNGVIVLGVEPGSPADNAGIIVGDVLIALNERLTGDTDEVQAVLTPESVGQTIKATLLRGGENLILDLTVGERPAKRNR